MESPQYNLASWQETDFPPSDELGPFPVYTGVTMAIQPSGSVATRGQVEARRGNRRLDARRQDVGAILAPR